MTFPSVRLEALKLALDFCNTRQTTKAVTAEDLIGIAGKFTQFLVGSETDVSNLSVPSPQAPEARSESL